MFFSEHSVYLEAHLINNNYNNNKCCVLSR